MLSRLVLQVRMVFGYTPNVEWVRASMSRAVALDRAKAHLAIAEFERCLPMRRRGQAAHCFGKLRG